MVYTVMHSFTSLLADNGSGSDPVTAAIIIGTVVSVIICCIAVFVIPALVYWRLKKKQGSPRYILLYVCVYAIAM